MSIKVHENDANSRVILIFARLIEPVGLPCQDEKVLNLLNASKKRRLLVLYKMKWSVWRDSPEGLVVLINLV